MTQSASTVAQSGTFAIGGDLPVHRLGYGVMQLPGPGVWGPPRDHDEAIRVLRRVVELGAPTLGVGIRSLSAPERALVRERRLPIVWGRELEREGVTSSA